MDYIIHWFTAISWSKLYFYFSISRNNEVRGFILNSRKETQHYNTLFIMRKYTIIHIAHANKLMYEYINILQHTWSPNAWRPTTILLVHPGTSRGIFLQIMASLKTVPPSMFLIVPLGDLHIFFNLNSTEYQQMCLPHKHLYRLACRCLHIIYIVWLELSYTLYNLTSRCLLVAWYILKKKHPYIWMSFTAQ